MSVGASKMRNKGDKVKANRLKLTLLGLCASTLLSAGPALGETTYSSGGEASAVSAAAGVSAFYNTWQSQPIWFKGGVSNPAIGELVSILQRAPFDGFAGGPQLAQQVQAAVAQAQSGNQAEVTAAERVLSTAWVEYVQAVKKPTTGLIYA